MLLTSTAVSDHRLCAREAQSSSQHHHRGDGIFLRFWAERCLWTRAPGIASHMVRLSMAALSDMH